MNYKYTLYDWLGYNQILFEKIHHFSNNETFIKIFIYLTKYVGEYMLFPLHFLLLVIFMMSYIMITQQKHNLHLQINYIKTIFILLFSIALGAIFIESLKLYFAFPRPYCGGNNITLNKVTESLSTFKISKCYKSFPSGHSWYVATFIFSIWGIMNRFFKITGIITLGAIGISRLIAGMHFPADVVFAILIASMMCGIAHKFSTKLLDIYKLRLEDKLRRIQKTEIT